MENFYSLQRLHLIELIKLTLPHHSTLSETLSLKEMINLTKEWILSDRLASLPRPSNSPYGDNYEAILNLFSKMGLRQSIYPKYQYYHAILLLGTTGLSFYKLWQDVISFFEVNHIKTEKIFLLGGDRAINPQYDTFETAYQLHPEHFTRFPDHNEVMKCPHEMALLELLTSALHFPEKIAKLPKISVFAKGHNGRRADTKDTLVALLEQHGDWLVKDKPLLLVGRWPHIIRQGIQAQSLMLDYQLDIASRFLPYLETLHTPLKGELPISHYLDALHWLLVVISQAPQYQISS